MLALRRGYRPLGWVLIDEGNFLEDRNAII
jgi:hypothetical protein